MFEPHRAPNLPRIHPAAWHGPIGETVRRIAPGTEADPAAVLATSLGLFGALAGDGAHVRVGGVRHSARVWPLIVGKTGSGRKGTSFAEARQIARRWSSYSDAYMRSRVVSGLASGEGLLAALGAANGGDADSAPVAPDGKLTVVESEFARTLSAAKRDGSTLGPILRQLWDDGAAAILTRAAPLTVNGAHLAVVAHITPKELRLRLAEADVAGGTLNRFLLIASERPHLLAHEPPQVADTGDLAEDLGKALDIRLGAGEMRRDRQANQLWTDVYRALSEDEPDGQLGAVLARGPAYTMRLALVYALADGAGAISTQHLLAGLAVWQYAARSARVLFPDETRRDDLQRLAGFISEAGAAGCTATDVSRFFRKNKAGDELRAMVDELTRGGQVEEVKETRAGGGRPASRFRWTGKHLDPITELLQKYELNDQTTKPGVASR